MNVIQRIVQIEKTKTAPEKRWNRFQALLSEKNVPYALMG